METCIQQGDWYKVMIIARRFYENAKIGDNKDGNKEFKERLTALLKSSYNHTDQGIEDLYDGIWKMFEFTSKYMHDKDKKGELMNRSVAKKADSYFVYMLASGFMGLLGSVISSED